MSGISDIIVIAQEWPLQSFPCHLRRRPRVCETVAAKPPEAGVAAAAADAAAPGPYGPGDRRLSPVQVARLARHSPSLKRSPGVEPWLRSDEKIFALLHDR